MTLASSISLPELSTASAHLRNRVYRPPWLASRSLATSAWDRFSRLPLGVTRAWTASGRAILASIAPLCGTAGAAVARAYPQTLLGPDADGRVAIGHQPDLDHVRVGDGDAAIGPVARL